MKIKPSKREVKSFRNKYLALSIISLLFFATSQAQWIKPNNSYGTISNGQSIERVLFFPTGCGTPNKLNIPDSAVNKFAIYGDSCGNVAYLYNPRTKIWSPISNGSGIIQDGLISGGIVTWSGSGLKFYISPAIYVIGGKFYNSPFDSVTLATAPTSDSRIDLIGVDTTGHAFATTGTASATPLVPQADITSQIALTTGILLNAGDTVPSNVTTDIVYSEGIKPPDWDTLTQGTPMVVNFSNTTNPYAGSKDVYVSKYSQGSTLKFVSPSLYPVTTDATLSFWIYLNGKFTNQIYAQLYDASTSASAWLRITPYFNINDSAKYQLVTVPVSGFAWTKYSGNFDRVLFNLTGYDTSGTKGFQLDNIQFQKGINSIPPPTDYSNKLDSILLSNDSLFQYSKGVKTFKGLASGSGTGNNNPDSLNNHAGSEYLLAVDTTDKWIPTGTTFPINVVSPIKAIDSTTIGLDSLSLVDTLLKAAFDAKQNLLVSGTNIKTINGNSLLGSGDLTIAGVDSTAVHPSGITTSGDTALVFSDLYGNSTAVSLSISQHWKKIGNDLYYPSGNVNIGLGTKPAGLLSLVSNPITSTSIIDDTTGLILKDSTDATSGNGKWSPPLVYWTKAYVTAASASQNVRFKVQAQGLATSANGNLYWYFSGNDGAYSQVMQLSSGGNLTIPGAFSATSTIAAGGQVSGSALSVSRSSNNSTSISSTDNIVSGNTGTYNTWRGLYINPTITGTLGVMAKAIQTNIGDVILNATSGYHTIIGKDTTEHENKLSIVSTSSFFGLPSMTSAQRDAVYSTFTGTLAGGSGYTSTGNQNMLLMGGSGTGAEARLVLSGGVVTSFTLTKPGIGYKVGDVLVNATTLGGGTGFSYTITALTPPRAGSTLFNSNTTSNQYWNGHQFVSSGVITGTATLSSGTVTVSNASVLSTSKIFVSFTTPSGTQGFLSAPSTSIVAGTSFVINSSSASDNSTVNWAIVN